MKGRIWLIGGTSESVSLAQLLANFHIPCIITVTTPPAATLYPQTPLLKILVGKLDLSALKVFLETETIVAVVDASHPYAVAISQGAIAATTSSHIPYLRYERPIITDNTQGVIYLDNFELLLQNNYLLNQRVLLTIGYKMLPLFQSWHNRCTLFTRILPSITSLEIALNSGFSPDKIIALRPPFTTNLEQALWQQWQISLVVTKASGNAGGENIKRSVANTLGIPLIIITRPQITYPKKTENLNDVIQFCLLVMSQM